MQRSGKGSSWQGGYKYKYKYLGYFENVFLSGEPRTRHVPPVCHAEEEQEEQDGQGEASQVSCFKMCAHKMQKPGLTLYWQPSVFDTFLSGDTFFNIAHIYVVKNKNDELH